MTDTPTLDAIDPKGCGCLECLTGEYKPIEKATREDILALVKGDLRNNTNYGFTLTFSPDKIEVSPGEAIFQEWTFDIWEDGLTGVDPTDLINRLVYDRTVF